MTLKTHLKIAGRRPDDWAALTPVYCGQSPPDGFSYFVGQGKITCRECKKHEPEAARHELQKRRARKMARRVTLASLGKRKPDARVTELAETDAVLLTIPWAPARGSRARFSVDVVAEKDDPLGGWKWAVGPETLSVLAPEQCAAEEERRRILARSRPPAAKEKKRLAELERVIGEGSRMFARPRDEAEAMEIVKKAAARVERGFRLPEGALPSWALRKPSKRLPPFAVLARPGTKGKCDAAGCTSKPDVSFLTTNADVWFCKRHARELGEVLARVASS